MINTDQQDKQAGLGACYVQMENQPVAALAAFTALNTTAQAQITASVGATSTTTTVAACLSNGSSSAIVRVPHQFQALCAMGQCQ